MVVRAYTVSPTLGRHSQKGLYFKASLLHGETLSEANMVLTTMAWLDCSVLE